MKVTQEFLDNLGFRGGWNLETINDKTYYTIVNPIYCQIFWFRYWHDIGSVNFANQNFIVQLQDGIMTHKVVLDPNSGDLLHTPLAWTMISYLGGMDFKPEPIFNTSFSSLTVLIVYFIVIVVIMLIFSNK